MANELLLQLAPLKTMALSILFFYVAWIATKKIVILFVAGLSLGQCTIGSLTSLINQAGQDPTVLHAAAAAGVEVHGGSVGAVIIANALLAGAMTLVVRAIKINLKAWKAEREREMDRLASERARERSY